MRSRKAAARQAPWQRMHHRPSAAACSREMPSSRCCSRRRRSSSSSSLAPTCTAGRQWVGRPRRQWRGSVCPRAAGARRLVARRHWPSLGQQLPAGLAASVPSRLPGTLGTLQCVQQTRVAGGDQAVWGRHQPLPADEHSTAAARARAGACRRQRQRPCACACRERHP